MNDDFKHLIAKEVWHLKGVGFENRIVAACWYLALCDRAKNHAFVHALLKRSGLGN